MSPTEAIPLLIVVLLMISVGGGDVQEMSVTFQGTTDVDSLADVHVVAGGTTTVPENAAVDGDIYVIGGTAAIDGTVDGDVTLLDGNLSINDGAIVTGTLQTYSGSAAISSDTSVGRVSQFEAPTPSSSPAQRVGGFLLQFLVIGAFGWWLVKRHPLLFENVGAAITEHALVSGVVGSLGATTLLVFFDGVVTPGLLLGVIEYPLFLGFVVLFGGGLEEPGWRGYLLPALQDAYSPLMAGLLVGVVWAGWHLPLVFIPGTIQNTLPLGLYLLQLVELSILLAWLTNRVDGRILPAILLHAGTNVLLNYYPVGGAAGVTTPLGFGLLVMMLTIAVVALVISAGPSLGVARPAR